MIQLIRKDPNHPVLNDRTENIGGLPLRTLTFPAPDALLGRLSADEYAPARVTASAPAVRHGATATLDVYYALADCPALANLNLPALGGGVRRELAWDD